MTARYPSHAELASLGVDLGYCIRSPFVRDWEMMPPCEEPEPDLPAFATSWRDGRRPHCAIGDLGYFPEFAAVCLGEEARLLGAFPVAVQQSARAAVLAGWQKRFPGSSPNLATLQAIQAIGAHEGSYGMGWKAGTSPVSGQPWGMQGSNNWGAVMCKAIPVNGVCPVGCGLYTDSHPTASGQKKFDACFIRYATPADGAAGIVAILQHMPKVLAALPGGNLDEIAWQMREAHYFEGFTTDHHKAAASYAAALDAQAKNIAAALNEPQAARRMGLGMTPGASSGSSVSTSVWWWAAAALVGAIVVGGSAMGASSRGPMGHRRYRGTVRSVPSR